MEMGRRGGAIRFSKKQSGYGFYTTLKKLGLADEHRQEMDYEFPPSVLENSKSKLPKKNLKNTNGVDHVSVPRKLRSAVKKRNLESVSKLSSASNRLKRSKTRIETLKESQEMEAKAIVPDSMMISKDEKEVAETLYSLAEMFTVTKSIDNKTCDEIETRNVDSIMLVEPEPVEPGILVLSSAKTKLIDEMPLEKCDKPLSSTGLKQNSSVNVTDSPVIAVEASGMNHQSNGLVLWPSLSSTVHSGVHILSKSSLKLPHWMSQAVSPSMTGSLVTEPLRVHPRKLKKCATHIYISRLIKVLQTSKCSSPLTLDQTEQRSSKMSEHRLPDPVQAIGDFKAMLSPSKGYQNQFVIDLDRTPNPKPVQENMTQIPLELHNPSQSYDFLALSSSAAGQSHFPVRQYQISTAFNSQISSATSSHQVQQFSPYLTTRFQAAYNGNQQLQKRLWAAQYRPTSVNIMPPSPIQYSKPNLSLNPTSIQPLQVASSPSYNNNNVSQQQHRLMAAAAAAMYPSRTVMNRQEHHFPLIYGDARTPSQLLCNDQL